MRFTHRFLVVSSLLACAACSEEDTRIIFNDPVKVNVTGYSGHIMEPFLSRDGAILLFNNLNRAPENTNIHWATRVDDLNFEYLGEIQNINTEFLEGVPTMDTNGILYFVSTRTYEQTFSTIYSASLSGGNASDIVLVPGLSKNLPGWVNFDVEVDPSGTYLYFVDGTFDENGGPYTADLVLAQKDDNGFSRMSSSAEILKNINTQALEYAAGISADGLELYFTRVEPPISVTSTPKIYVATRTAPDLPFHKPQIVKTITGFAEAPTLSPNGRIVYYHQLENDVYQLYAVTREK